MQVVDVAEHVQLSVLRPQLLEKPDVVVGTPSRILAHVKAGKLCIADARPEEPPKASSSIENLPNIGTELLERTISYRQFGSELRKDFDC